MSNSHSVEIDRIKGTEVGQVSFFRAFISHTKTYLLIAFIVAVAFWALVLPYFSESIIKAVTK